MRLLLVDDEPVILEQLSRVLAEQKYDVVTASDGQEALDRIFDYPYDLIILDIMLPKIGGLSFLHEIREAKIDTPVLLLSAKGEIADKIEGLDQGADDYLAKPFSAAELLARIRALLRRSSEHGTPALKVGEIELDTIRRQVSRKGVPLKLTPKEFSILEFLLYNKSRTVSRISLAEHVWGEDFDPFTMSNSIDVHIKNLRQKIGDSDSKVIRTVRGVGYLLREDG